jgi:hypothetical protein
MASIPAFFMPAIVASYTSNLLRQAYVREKSILQTINHASLFLRS